MNENKVLLVKGIAGLGNRILFILTGVLHAQLTGRRLVVDWADRFIQTIPSASGLETDVETRALFPGLKRPCERSQEYKKVTLNEGEK